MTTDTMKTAFERSMHVFPAGSNGEFNLPPELSMVIGHGKGCELWDTEGKRYLDYSIGWGSVLVGHACAQVVENVQRQIVRGSNFAYTNEQSLELAEELIRLSPAMETMRFCASGTEATMYCIRLARAYTGRPKILKFEGAYHGANDVGVTSLFPNNPPDYPTPDPTSAGVSQDVTENILIAPFNDLETTRAIVEAHKHELAGAIVEPLQRCTPPVEGFLQGLRQLTIDNDMLLLFDEVVTGFRLAYGGAQEYYGVVPDMVAYGKALGGGYPIGAYGGRRDVMQLVEEDRMGRETYVWTASSLGGNPVSCAAARGALAVLSQPGTYEHLHAMGNTMREGMRDVLKRCGVEGQIIGDGPLAQVVFSTGPVTNYRSTNNSNKTLARKVMLGLFKRGIFLNPMGTKLYLSIEHGDLEVGEFLEKFEMVLEENAG